MVQKIIAAVLVVAVSGCASMSNTEKGAAIGAAAGALLGGVIGKTTADKTTTGVVVGAAVGGIAGGIIGAQMDKQAEELEKELEGVEVERVGEGIVLTFDSAILFAVDRSDLSDSSKESLRKLAESLADYPNTNILIGGHTDATGSDSYNQALSERRAMAAAEFLAASGVKSDRLTIVGYGETQPVADNSTAEGRAQNRRVEIAITANEEFQQQAQQQNPNGN